MNDVIELDYEYNFFPEPDPFMAVALRPHDGKDLRPTVRGVMRGRSEEHTSELQSPC